PTAATTGAGVSAGRFSPAGTSQRVAGKWERAMVARGVSGTQTAEESGAYHHAGGERRDQSRRAGMPSTKNMSTVYNPDEYLPQRPRICQMGQWEGRSVRTSMPAATRFWTSAPR